MGNWGFLTNHARALLFIAYDPRSRLRDLAAALDVTERTAYGIVVDLTDAGYVVKEKEGRRNRYHIQGGLPLADSIAGHRTIGEVLDLLVDARAQGGRNGIAPDGAPRGGSGEATQPALPGPPLR